jgi:predicted nucleotidyltransferase
MYFTQDMRELIDTFEKHQVLYVLVGGYAVNYHGYVRSTQDIDFLVMPSKENAENVMKALSDFGFGGAGIPQDYFEREGTAIHLGVEPNRIDLLTTLQGVSNTTVFENAERVEFGGVLLNIIGYDDLLAAKRQSKRPRDLADADELEKSRAGATSRIATFRTPG